uniref:Uncharacterized protein n=1 Tax=Arundo donax TaxID=35708 RepID=A0A0A8YCH7_ARUDO
MQILLVPFFATSHIGPFIDLAIRLATAKPGAVEPTVAVTRANVSAVRSALERHGPAASGLVRIVTYPFPSVDGLPPGVENLSAPGEDAWRIDAAAMDEALTPSSPTFTSSGTAPSPPNSACRALRSVS